MFQNDENEKEQHQAVHEECLVVIKTLQITHICAFKLVLKKTNFQTIKFSDKKVFRANTLSDKSLSKSLIV